MADHKPPQPVSSLRVAYEGTLGPATWAVVHWFLVTQSGALVLANLNELVDDLGEIFAQRFINVGYVSSSCHFTRIKATLRDADGTSMYRTSRVADVAGTGSGDSEAAQVCVLIDWATGDPRRGGKPRSYLPGVTDESLSDSARLTPAAVVAFSSSAAVYITDCLALTEGTISNPEMVEMSFRNLNTWRAAAVAYPILGGAASDVVATQRRRVDRLRLT
jgi:hypothetical protein